jgi:hypothetical protein
VLNDFNGGFNSFGDAVKNLLGQIISWFLSLGAVVTKIIDAIFGTNWTAGLEALRSNILKWGKNENAITLEHNVPQISRISYSSAKTFGGKAGDWITDKMSNIFGLKNNEATPSIDTSAANKAQSTLDNINGNTKSIADEVSTSKDDLKLIADMAAQKEINKYTTAEIKVDMSGMQNHLASDMDIDGFINVFTQKFQNAVISSAEGVHV